MTRPADAGIRRRPILLVGLAASGAIAFGGPLAGCGGAAALVVPFFTFQFVAVTTVNGTRAFAFVNLNPDTASRDKSSGSFDRDNSNIRFQNPLTGAQIASSPVSGTFDQRSLRLVVAQPGAPLAPAYDGTFVADDSLQLTPVPSGAATTPALTFMRADQSFVPDLFRSAWAGSDSAGRSRRSTFASVTDINGNPVFGGDDTTVLFTGTDVVAGLPNGIVTGFANMRQIELTITRPGQQPVTQRGVLNPPGVTPPTLFTPVPATEIVFEDGSRLRRA